MAVSKPAVTQCRVQTSVNFIGLWNGTATFSKGASGTTPLQMKVTDQTRHAYFSGVFTQLDSTGFKATIGKTNRISITFTDNATGSAVGTINLAKMVFEGSFSLKEQ